MMSLLLALALLQDSIGDLVERLSSENLADREAAVEQIVGRWDKWTDDDLKTVDEAAASDDKETSVGAAREAGASALERVRAEIAVELDQARSAFEAEASGLAYAAAVKILGREL